MMERYAYCDEQNIVQWVARGMPGDAAAYPVAEGHSVHLCDEQVAQGWIYQDGDFQAPSAPVRSIEELRQLKWQSIKATRDAMLLVTPTAIGPLDTDETGKGNLLGTVQSIVLAGSAAPETITWKLADNRRVTVPTMEFLDAAVSVTTWVQAIYQTSWALETAIQQASNEEELEAVEWPQNPEIS